MEGQKGDIEDVSKVSTKAAESGPEADSATHESLIVEDVPDPEEDDLDDLDDMLDEFSATEIHAQDKVPETSGPGRPTAAVNAIPGVEGISDEDFAKQLEAGMAELLGGMETSNCRHSLRLCLKSSVEQLRLERQPDEKSPLFDQNHLPRQVKRLQ